jgi:hypothetical protein
VAAEDSTPAAINRGERTVDHSARMSWIRKFEPPIALKDGRVLVTLAEAHRLMLSLPEPHLRNHHWQDAAALMQKAASRGGLIALAQVRAQLPRALKAEGLI